MSPHARRIAGSSRRILMGRMSSNRSYERQQAWTIIER
jgi:hypothetical protein